VTRDHVVPGNLFLPPRPTNLITLPAHDKCNEMYSEDEEYFRIAMAGGLDTYEHPIARRVWDEKVIDSSLAGSWKLKRELADRLSDVEVHSPAGLYWGNAVALSLDWDRIWRVLQKIVRGLLCHHGGREFAGEITFTHLDERDEFVFGLLAGAPKHRIGDGRTFAYAGGSSTVRWQYSLWWLRFYETKVFAIFTQPVDNVPEEELD